MPTGDERSGRARTGAPEHLQINITSQRPLPRSAGTPMSPSNRAAIQRRRLGGMRVSETAKLVGVLLSLPRGQTFK